MSSLEWCHAVASETKPAHRNLRLLRPLTKIGADQKPNSCGCGRQSALPLPLFLFLFVFRVSFSFSFSVSFSFSFSLSLSLSLSPPLSPLSFLTSFLPSLPPFPSFLPSCLPSFLPQRSSCLKATLQNRAGGDFQLVLIALGTAPSILTLDRIDWSNK